MSAKMSRSSNGGGGGCFAANASAAMDVVPGDAAADAERDVLHVEIAVKESSCASTDDVVDKVRECVERYSGLVDEQLHIAMSSSADRRLLLGDEEEKDCESRCWARTSKAAAKSYLEKHVDRIRILNDDKDKRGVAVAKSKLLFYVYRLNCAGAEEETIEDEGQAEINAASHSLLPNAEFEDLWENLVYDTDVKAELLNYMKAILVLADHGVNPCVVTSNRVVLLHGPPGTGKTSLCKALAQKLSIRLNSRYKNGGQFIEINSHSLFSKWFSESAQLVQKMFGRIQEMVDDPDSLVVVLIDEVESLTTARKAGSNEPADQMRVVNAMLTQIDNIKKYPNVLILTTSNMTGAIDGAFVDRADLKKFIGLPSRRAIFNILHGCVDELVQKGLLKTDPVDTLVPLSTLEAYKFAESPSMASSLRLWELADDCFQVQLSGRMLRKLPVLAIAASLSRNDQSSRLFLKHLGRAIQDESRARQELAEPTTTTRKRKQTEDADEEKLTNGHG